MSFQERAADETWSSVRVKFVRTSLASALLCLLAGCSAEAQQSYTAQSSDERVSFFLSKAMTRDAFTSFCATPESEGRCDEFERYRMEVYIDDGTVGMTFMLRSTDGGSDRLQAFGCLWIQGQRTCRTGDHRY